MQSADQQPLLFQRVGRWLVSKGKENRLPMLAAFVFGFLAHTFAFTNKLLNHDEANSLFSKGGTIVLGRWGLGAMDSVFPNVSMPWIYGVITIALLAVSVCVVVHILHLRSGWYQVLAAGFIMTFPSLTGTFGYMFTSSSYGVAFLLAVLAVWLLQKPDKWFWAGALVCMVASLSIYQAYVSLAAGLLVLVVIRQLLDGEDAAAVLRRGIAYVVFLVLALGLYYGAALVILKLKHLEMVSYASDSLAFSPLSLPANIAAAYRAFFRFFREGSLCLIPTALSRTLHGILLICAAGMLLLRLIGKKRTALSLVLFAIALLLFPLAVCCMYLFTAPDSIHTLVMYGFVNVYLLVLVLAEGCRPAGQKWAGILRAAVLNAAPVLSALIIVINIYIANESYLTLQLRYENAYAFYTSLIADMKQSPDFTEGTRLAVIGTWKDPAFYEENLNFTNALTGVTGFKPDSYSKERFMQYYLGFSIPFASEAEQEEIASTEAYAAMPAYPYYGSMQKFGDILVVKLS